MTRLSNQIRKSQLIESVSQLEREENQALLTSSGLHHYFNQTDPKTVKLSSKSQSKWDGKHPLCIVRITSKRRVRTNLRREMSEKSMWIALWSVVAVVVLVAVAPLIFLVPLVLTVLFIGGGL